MMPTTFARCRPAGPTSSSVSPRSRPALTGVGTPEQDAAPLETGVGLGRLTSWNSVPSTFGCLAGSTPMAMPCSEPLFSPGSSSGIARSGATVPVSGIASIALLHRARHAGAAALLDREALRLDGEVAGEGLVDLVLDGADEARRHRAVDDDDREADRQRDGGGCGAQRVREERVRREPAAGRAARAGSGTASQRMTGRMTNGAAMAMPANIAIVITIPPKAARPPVSLSLAEPERAAEPEPREEQAQGRRRAGASRRCRGPARRRAPRGSARRGRRGGRARRRRAASRRCR